MRSTLVVTVVALLLTSAASAQFAVDSIDAPAGTEWRDLALYRGGGKLFILDFTGSRVLVFDAVTLASAGEISFTSYAPEKPRQLALHEGSGTLYVSVSLGQATSETDIVVVDADTHATGPVLADLGWSASLTVDEARSRLYAFSSSQKTVKVIDITTNTVDGTLSLSSLMPTGAILFGPEHVNPATGQLLFTNLHEDQFAIVDGETLTGNVYSAGGARGRSGTWSPPENKVYITTAAWNGYFIHDLDTASFSVTSCVNDGTSLYFSATANRVFSGAEVGGNSTVIEGASNACQNIFVGTGQAAVAFLPSLGQVFFAGISQVSAFDEDTLAEITTIPNCGSGGYGVVGRQVVANDPARRLFVQTTWSSPSQGSCLQVIDSPSVSIADAAMAEGDAGTSVLSFSVTLDLPVPETVTVDYATGAGGDDFDQATGTVTFAPGDTEESVAVTIHGDTDCEDSETFSVTLSNPTPGLSIADAAATGTITDDDRPPAPTNVVATAQTAVSVGITWSAVTGAASYDVYRSTSGQSFVKIGSSESPSYTDGDAGSATAYLYAVKTIDVAACPSPLSAPDLATTVSFADETLSNAIRVKAEHVTSLRSAIALVRSLAGLQSYSFTDAIAAGDPVKALHITQLRNALDAARSALGLSALNYTDPALTSNLTTIRAAHVTQLRNGVR